MKYLFFDLEFASCKGGKHKICEFGYVITNEFFEVLTRYHHIINPNIPDRDWDYRVLRKILTRKYFRYVAAPTFDEFYYDIVSLFKDADYVIGFSTNGDAEALNDECIRYNFKSIDYTFYDVRKFYKEFNNSHDRTKLVNILEQLNIEGEPRYHDAETDAYNTMLVLKRILETLNISFEDLIALCPKAKDKTENYIVESLDSIYKLKKIKSKKKRQALRLLDNSLMDLLVKRMNG